MGRHGCAVGGGDGGLEAGLVIGETPTRSPLWRTGWRSFPAARRACGRAGCRWIRSGSSPARAGEGSDEHYAELASVATVNQLRTAVKLEPRPEPEPDRPEPEASITKTSDEHGSYYRITLPASGGGEVRCGTWRLIVMRWSPSGNAITTMDADDSDQRPPLPSNVDGVSCVWSTPGWDAEAARRPHGQHTTVVVHVDVKDRIARCIWVRCSPMLIANT